LRLLAFERPLRRSGCNARSCEGLAEGFDTADLKDAKAVLDQLNP
jgi:hypothetical protein